MLLLLLLVDEAGLAAGAAIARLGTMMAKAATERDLILSDA